MTAPVALAVDAVLLVPVEAPSRRRILSGWQLTKPRLQRVTTPKMVPNAVIPIANATKMGVSVTAARAASAKSGWMLVCVVVCLLCSRIDDDDDDDDGGCCRASLYIQVRVAYAFVLVA